MPSFTQLGLALVRDGRAMGGQPLAPLEARHEVVGGAEEWGAASGAATGGDVHITLEAQRLCLDLRVRHGGLRRADDLSQQLLLSGRKGAIVATAAIRDRVVERLLLRASCCTCLLERPPSALCAVVGHLMLARRRNESVGHRSREQLAQCGLSAALLQRHLAAALCVGGVTRYGGCPCAAGAVLLRAVLQQLEK